MTRCRRLLFFARFGAADFGQVSRMLACDTKYLSCFEMQLSRAFTDGPKQARDWAPLVPARPLAAALVIETALTPFAR
jgi:hypothetical protein